MAPIKNLTAIKISGKNTRDRRRKQHHAPSKPTPSPGRPMKAAKDLKTPPSSKSLPSKKQQQQQKKPRSLKHIKSKRGMSRLEKLPTELLERVFLLCMELNLPRASPVIAAKLSSNHIYTTCAIAAFAPYWQRMHAWEDTTRDVQAMPASPDILGEDEASPQAQSAILRCRWATLDRLREAEQTWLRRKEQHLGTDRLHCMGDVCFTEDCLERWYADFVANGPSPSFHQWRFSVAYSKVLRFQPSTVEIPNSLISGPWTEEKLKHLLYLLLSGAIIEKYKSTAGEEAIEGLHAAILSGNIHAVLLLYKLGIHIPFTTGLVKEFLSRNYDTLPPKTMASFLAYFRCNHRSRLVIPVQNTLAQLTTHDFLVDDGETERAYTRLLADAEREVQLMRMQGNRDGDKKLVEWAGIIGKIYEGPKWRQLSRLEHNRQIHASDGGMFTVDDDDDA